jgi:hypothetical protein
MIFTVAWIAAAVNELADLWIIAPDRDRVTAAASTLDELLRHNPQTLGESRHGNVRILVEDPLGIDFEVVEDDRIVYVLSVWRTDERPSKS